MQLRDGTCGSFWLASLLCCVWELDPVPSCRPSHTLLGHGRAGALGPRAPSSLPATHSWCLTHELPRGVQPRPPTALGGGEGRAVSSDPSSLSSVLCIAVFALLLTMFCPKHTERSGRRIHLGVLPGLGVLQVAVAGPTRPVLYVGGGGCGLEEPRVSSSLDFLLMTGRQQGVVMTCAVLSVQQTRDRQLFYNLGSAGLGKV